MGYGRTPEIEYAREENVRKVRSRGMMKWQGIDLYVGEALAGEPVEMRQIDDRYWVMHYSFMPLAVYDEHIRSWVGYKEAAPIIENYLLENPLCNG